VKWSTGSAGIFSGSKRCPEIFDCHASMSTERKKKEKNSWLLGKMFESGFPDASGREEG
jgi:hypothetical protein